MNAEHATHLGTHALRQLFAGELKGEAAQRARTHADGCERCRAKLHELEQEQHGFEQTIDFDRFARGVEAAQRRARNAEVQARAQTRWLRPALAAAAMLVAVAVVGLGPILLRQQPVHRNGLKGGAGMDLVIKGAGNGPQRMASPDVAALLAPGERVRIGYQAGALGYVAAVSVDEHGEVTPLYPQEGQSPKVESTPESGDATHYLPDAWEFTGKGLERVVVVLTPEPLAVDALTRAAREAYQHSHGDLSRMDKLDVPGEQFHRMLVKP